MVSAYEHLNPVCTTNKFCVLSFSFGNKNLIIRMRHCKGFHARKQNGSPVVGSEILHSKTDAIPRTQECNQAPSAIQLKGPHRARDFV